MKNEKADFNNLKLLCKIIEVKIIPSKYGGTERQKFIIGFMEQVRKWEIQPELNIPIIKTNLTNFYHSITVKISNGKTNKIVTGIEAYNILFNYKEDIPHLSIDNLNIVKLDSNKVFQTKHNENFKEYTKIENNTTNDHTIENNENFKESTKIESKDTTNDTMIKSNENFKESTRTDTKIENNDTTNDTKIESNDTTNDTKIESNENFKESTRTNNNDTTNDTNDSKIESNENFNESTKIESNENFNESFKIESNKNFNESTKIENNTNTKIENNESTNDKGIVWKISLKDSPENIWYIEAKLVLSEEEMIKVATLLYDSQIPYGKTIQLQADAHIAGSYTWIGMIASYDDNRIPFVTISGDIGCGLSMIPLVFKNKHIKSTDVSNIDQLKLAFMLQARRSLYRGKKAESGDGSNIIKLLNIALEFFGDLINLNNYIESLDYMFDILDIDTNNGCNLGKEFISEDKGDLKNENNKKENTNYKSRSLEYATKFSQSLGSSGNHFIELSESSDNNFLYTVIHSGSRGLGSMIYNKISLLVRIHTGNNIAIGNLAKVYNKSFDVLCKFAQLNRILCGLSVLENLNFSIDGNELKNHMINSCIFKDSNLNDNQKTKLLFGLTHNGIKTFVNHSTKKYINILSKGAIALSRKHDIGIVALRAGDGCDMFILNDSSAQWEESDYSFREECKKKEEYTQIFNLDETDILFAGHGAGRTGSATGTRKKSSYEQMITYYQSKNFIGNLSPNVLGDNPEIAYKSPEEIRKKLPIKEAIYYTNLKTLVNHKEGIDHHWAMFFANFCVNTYESADFELKLWYDVGLVRHVRETHIKIENMFNEQGILIDTFLKDFNDNIFYDI